MGGSSRAERGDGQSWSEGPGGVRDAGGLAWSDGVSRSESLLSWLVAAQSTTWAARQLEEGAAALPGRVLMTKLRPAFSGGKKTASFAPQAASPRLCCVSVVI